MLAAPYLHVFHDETSSSRLRPAARLVSGQTEQQTSIFARNSVTGAASMFSAASTVQKARTDLKSDRLLHFRFFLQFTDRRGQDGTDSSGGHVGVISERMRAMQAAAG